MRDIIFILGLPGSGKTMLAESLLTGGRVLIDDFCNVVKNGDPRSALKTAGLKVVITDPKACQVKPQVVLEKLEEWGGPCQVHFIAFENNLEACMTNMKRREDSGDVRAISREFMESLAQSYDPKEWGEVRPVWTVDR